MKTTPLPDKEDLNWLAETHLKAFRAKSHLAAYYVEGYAYAEIDGNENCPSTIRLWKRTPRFNTPPTLVFTLQEDGSYLIIGGTSKLAKRKP